MDFNKKQLSIIIVLLSVIVVLLGCTSAMMFQRKYDISKDVQEKNSINPVIVTEENTPSSVAEGDTSGVSMSEEGWSIDSLKKGLTTAIEHEEVLNDNITSIEAAEKCISDFGDREREKYDNPAVKIIEKRIQENYGIFAVNLGEMEEETALDVEVAVDYMYSRYPELRGKLTNITLANTDSFKSGHLAVTQCKEYVINGEYTVCPYVVKHEILLSASAFLQREELIKKCEQGVEEGHWPEGMNIKGLIVHELGHQVLNAYTMEYYGYDNPYYVTEDTKDAFAYYITDALKANQTVSQLVLNNAYEEWKKENTSGTYEDFCYSISGYAGGVQSDGGISYPETVAEALTDIFLNGEDAAYASKCIENALKRQE